jgi:hypothetical protein
MNLLSVLESITFLLIIKVLVVVLLIVYTIFAFLMMKQIGAMTRAVSMKDDFVIRMLGVLHFAFAAFTLLLAIIMM